MENHYPQYMTQDTPEADRLGSQHHYLIQITSFKIHPRIILSHSGKSLKIADIGTGTGIFLLDIASDLPSTTQLHGFDITDAHFPAEQIPQNVDFHKHDIRVPFAEEFRGKFDLVCIRMVILGLKGEEWDMAARNVTALLKPGGYLQWIEPDHSNSQILHAKPGAPSTATKQFFDHLNEWMKANAPINGSHLAHNFQNNDLEIVTEDVYGTDHYQGVYHTPMLVETTAGGFLRRWLVAKGVLTGEEVDALIARSMEECGKGDVYQHSLVYVVVGRKVSVS